MILACHHLSKAFGTREIVRDASFVIEEHEKAAIVGVNGSGKSTILKMIVGELEPDEGQVILSHGRTMGYLAQQKMLTGHQTIYEELREAKKNVIDAEQRLHVLEAQMQTVRGEELETVMQQYHQLHTWFEQHDGYALESSITGVLKGLGFSEQDFSRNCDSLSGGERTRVALGKLLLSMPDIILLDEPINHLDMTSIAWLETYLLNYRGAVVIVAHDRYFLNKVVTKVIEIDHTKVTTFQGNYAAYAQKKQMLRETALKAWLNQQQEIKHQEAVIEKLRSFNREKSIKRAESREKMLDKIKPVEKPHEDTDGMRLTLTPQIISGNDVLMVEGLSKSFGDRKLFEDLSFEIKRGERVALIGDNGTGKTTILKIINDLLQADTGRITLGTKVHIGYYDQEHQVLHGEKTLFDEISDAWPDLTQTQIRNTLAAFLFTGDDVFKLISEISGGERGRVSLAKLMLSKANFLILDEPTNHLDIFSKEILEDALCAYSGTVLYVSHDRYFINRTATRILELKDTSLTNYIGNYDYYLEKKEQINGMQRSAAADQAAAAGRAEDTVSDNKSDWMKQKEEQARARKAASDLKKTEKEIERLEERDRQIDQLLLQDEVFSDPSKCAQLGTEKAQIAEQLSQLYETWEKLASLQE